jgi:predicted ATP-grasp superfamily ATP-dependent carboligase
MNSTINKQIKKTLENFNFPVIGASVQPFGRIGIEEIFPHFSIACLRYSEELEQMRKENIPIFCLEEALEKNPKGKRNTTTVLRNKLFQKFLKKIIVNNSQKPVLILYKSSQEIERLAKKFNWILAANSQKLYKKLENKLFFKKLIKKLNINGIPGEIKPLGKLIFRQLISRYPGGFVIQNPSSGGGKGTFFITNEKGFENCVSLLKKEPSLNPNSKIIITKFIKGYSPSVTGCVIRNGILQLPPQIQLIDIKELCLNKKNSGTFCGHDWSVAKKIDKQASREMKMVTEKIGTFLKQKGFKGIFGIDFLVDQKDNSVFPVELNPRLLGTFPVSTLVQLKNNEVPLIAFHILEFAGKKIGISLKKLNQELSNHKEGSHLFIASPYPSYKIRGKLRAGVYKLCKGNLKFLRQGYKFKHLKNKKEFLLVDGVPHSPRIETSGLFRILRVVSPIQISQKMGKELNFTGRKIVKAVYKELKIRSL